MGGKKLVEPTEVSNKEKDKACILDQECSDLYNNKVWECIECYLNLPEIPHPDQNLLNYAHISQLQQQDKQLFDLQVNYPNNYINLQLDDNIDDIICYKKDPTQPYWNKCAAQSNGS